MEAEINEKAFVLSTCSISFLYRYSLIAREQRGQVVRTLEVVGFSPNLTTIWCCS